MTKIRINRASLFDAGEAVDEFDSDIREGIDNLDGEIFALVVYLPLAYVAREGIDELDADVGE